MQHLPHGIAPPLGHRANLGLIVLQSDETLEHEFASMTSGDGIATYVTRIPSAEEVSSETLAAMERALPDAAGLLPASVSFDVVGYGCTSGATVIGPAKVAELVTSRTGARHVTNPLTALLAALRALSVERLALVTPYVPEVTETMRDVLERKGIEIASTGSFMLAEEARVARIDGPSIIEAARRVAGASACDAVFLSCTNLRASGLIARIEAEIGIPAITSNQALAWHMQRLAGIDMVRLGYGRLFAAGLSTMP